MRKAVFCIAVACQSLAALPCVAWRKAGVDCVVHGRLGVNAALARRCCIAFVFWKNVVIYGKCTLKCIFNKSFDIKKETNFS
jgi:hypothetical protein